FAHCFALITGTNNTEPLMRLTDTMTLGTLGVIIFFVISGFLITQSWCHHPHPLNFLWNRSLRIFPGLFGVTIITIFLIGPLVTTLSTIQYFTNPMTLNYFSLINIFGATPYLPGVFENNPFPRTVNGSLWILSSLFEMYLILMGIGFFKILKKRGIVLGWVITSILLFIYFSQNVSTHFLTLSYCFAPLFFMIGVLYYLYKDKIKYNFKVAILLTIIWVMSFNTPLFILISFINLPYIILYIAHAKIPHLNMAGKYGDFSYGLYIYAFPIQQTIIHFFTKISVIEMFLLTLLIVIPISFLSMKFIEENALKLKRVDITQLIYRIYKTYQNMVKKNV
ncbi:MAG: acyltransferase, partial [Methanobacterium paludis]|nr:acyltransferase [Methanobacterium paludis]